MIQRHTNGEEAEKNGLALFGQCAGSKILQCLMPLAMLALPLAFHTSAAAEELVVFRGDDLRVRAIAAFSGHFDPVDPVDEIDEAFGPSFSDYPLFVTANASLSSGEFSASASSSLNVSASPSLIRVTGGGQGSKVTGAGSTVADAEASGFFGFDLYAPCVPVHVRATGTVRTTGGTAWFRWLGQWPGQQASSGPEGEPEIEFDIEHTIQAGGGLDASVSFTSSTVTCHQ